MVKCVVKFNFFWIGTKFGVVVDMDPMIIIVVTKRQKDKKAKINQKTKRQKLKTTKRQKRQKTKRQKGKKAKRQKSKRQKCKKTKRQKKL